MAFATLLEPSSALSTQPAASLEHWSKSVQGERHRYVLCNATRHMDVQLECMFIYVHVPV